MMEHERLAFIESRDGVAAAKDFAIRTLRNYRKCLLQDGSNGTKRHFASLPHYKPLFIESYCVLKRYYFRDR